jgi:mannose-6-phosphate isomerase-like protein (cupin superfamily)
MTLPDRSAVVLDAGEGADVSRRNGRDVILKAVAEQTGGRFAVYEAAHPPAVPGPPVHRHPHSDEAFYVLDGDLRVLAGDTEHTIGPGGFVLVPGGMAHTFATAGDRPARFLVIHGPAGFESFSMAVAEAERKAGRELGPAELTPIAAQFDWEIVGPPLAVSQAGTATA